MPAVDHLRLFAALMVLAFHAYAHFYAVHLPWPHPAHWPGLLVTEGYAGVTLFMVLSGFILTHAALGRKVSYGPFLRNRAFRLLPLLLVAFLLSAAVAPGALQPQLLMILILPTHTFGLGSFFIVAWSVVVEIELYLMFPVLLRHLEEGGPRRMLSIIALLAGLRLAALAQGADAFGLLFTSVLSRADQFILGMVAAWVLKQHGSRLWALAGLPGITLTIGLLASFNRTSGIQLSGGSAIGHQLAALSPTLEGLGWAAVVLGYVVLMQGVTGRISRAVARVGATSYSIYLLHLLIIKALAADHVHIGVGGTPFRQALFTVAVIVVPLTLVTARLSYNLIELPFLRRRVRWIEESPQPVPIPLTVAPARAAG